MNYIPGRFLLVIASCSGVMVTKSIKDLIP